MVILSYEQGCVYFKFLLSNSPVGMKTGRPFPGDPFRNKEEGKVRMEVKDG